MTLWRNFVFIWNQPFNFNSFHLWSVVHGHYRKPPAWGPFFDEKFKIGRPHKIFRTLNIMPIGLKISISFFIISHQIHLKSGWTGISGYFVPRAIWEVEVSSVTLGTTVRNHHNRSFTVIAICPNVPWIWDYYAFRNHGQLKTTYFVNLTCGACGLDTAATMNSFIPNWFRNCNEELLCHRAKFWETAISPMRLRRVNGDISWRFWS